MPCRKIQFSSRCIVILLVLFLLLSVFPVFAFATNTENSFEEELVLTGSFEGTFDLSRSKSKLFHLENMVPGDSWTGEIVIKNKAPEAMTVRLLSIVSNLEDMALFNALDLKILEGDEVIYSGGYNTGISPITKTYELDSRESITLTVTVSLPASAGNEIMDKEMDSTWTFEAFYTLGSDKPHTGIDLITSNTAGLFVLWIVLIAGIAVTYTVLRIRNTKRTACREKEDSTK